VGRLAGAARFGTGIPAAGPHRSSEFFQSKPYPHRHHCDDHLALASAPGNVLLPRRVSGLRAESVINVSRLVALDRSFLTDQVGKISPGIQASVDAGLRLVLELGSAIS
jgi:hypothetical protein